jgi:uncharacterized RDD family membrane protein YckC
VIKTCQQCGAVNGDPSDVCCFCDALLGGAAGSSISRKVTILTEGNLAVEPEWRREVSSRLQDYRARRRGRPDSDLQTALPFDSVSAVAVETTAPRIELASPAPPRKTVSTKARRSERFEISIPNVETSASSRTHLPAAAPSASTATVPLYAVASLPERRRAAVADVALLVFSYGGMLALFTVLGGRIGLNKTDLAVAVATFMLFYAQYFAVFTVFGGSTPGMMARGLRVVSFDGGVPSSQQMIWRSFGYLISAGTVFLGFIWALWDDDLLCWQDRISKTYVTPVEEIRHD